MTTPDSRKPTFIENVQTVNSAVRTALMLAVAGVLGFGGYTGYKKYIVPGIEGKQAMEKLASLQTKYDEQEEQLKTVSDQNEKLSTSMKLLKVDRRMAHITVDRKYVDESGNKMLEVSFSELDDKGKVIGSTREFTLKGDKFFIDCWVAKFEDKYIEQADPLRSATIVAFKSIFGDEMKHVDALPLDDFTKPGVYAQTVQSAFEKQIWADFAKACNDPEVQKDLGIRAIHGSASYLMPVEGKTYELTVRSSGSISLVPLTEQ